MQGDKSMLNTQSNSANDMKSLKVLLTLLGILLISMQFVSAADAEGWLDVIRPDRYATGWAIDSDYSGATEVHFYVDGTDPNTHFAGALSANQYSQDVLDQNFGDGNNRFYFLIPDKYRDGQQHTLRAYAIGKNADGSNSDRNIELQGSPKTFMFLPQCTSFTYSQWSSCTNGEQTRTLQAIHPTACVYDQSQLEIQRDCRAPVGSVCQTNDHCFNGGVCNNNICSLPISICTSFTYGEWGSCSSGQQTRTITSATPENCVGGNPITTQSCTGNLGAICTSNSQCSNNNCYGNICTQFKSHGDSCDSRTNLQGAGIFGYTCQPGTGLSCVATDCACTGQTAWSTTEGRCISTVNPTAPSPLNGLCNSTLSCGTHSFSGNTVQLSCMDNDNNGEGVCRIPTSSLCPTSISNACLNSVSCVDTNNDGVGLCQNTTTVTCPSSCSLGCVSGTTTCITPTTPSCPSSCTNGCVAGTTTCNPPTVVTTPTCTSFTYTSFSVCTAGTQSRTVTSSSPSGCTGGSPSLTQSCTDITPPSSVANLNVIPLPTSAIVSWTNPVDSDFLRVLLFLNNVNIANLTGTSYTITGLQQNTTYNVSLQTIDTSGNINILPSLVNFRTTTSTVTPGNGTNGTGATNDTIPPAAVSNLRVTSLSDNSIIWAWNNPSNPDFQAAILMFNNVNVLNTSSNTFTALGLGSGTSYTLTVFTRDTSGNINQTGVSSTVTTTGGSPGAGSGSSSSDDDDDDDGRSSGSPRRSATANIVTNPDRFGLSSTDNDAIYLDSPTTKYSTSFLGSKAFAWTLFALCVVLAFGVIAALNYRKE